VAREEEERCQDENQDRELIMETRGSSAGHRITSLSSVGVGCANRGCTDENPDTWQTEGDFSQGAGRGFTR
jgi:hypothetical protein